MDWRIAGNKNLGNASIETDLIDLVETVIQMRRTNLVFTSIVASLNQTSE